MLTGALAEVSVGMSPDAKDLPFHTPLPATADEALDRIAGLVRKVLHVPVGLVSLVDRDGQVFPGQAGLPAPWSDTRCTPLTHSFCQYVVRSGEPLVVADARLDPVLKTNLAIVDIDVIAYAGFPLVDRDGSTVGSLCAIDTVPREWTDSEVSLLGDLAAACSAELQLRSSAVAAQDAQANAITLLEFSETLSSTLTTADVSQAVSKLATGRLGAAFGGVTVLDPLRATLTYVDREALPGSAQAHYQFMPLSATLPSPVAAREGKRFFFETLTQMWLLFPEAARALEEAESGAAVYLPLAVADRVVGTIAILWAEERIFDDADRTLLVALSRYTAQAVERAVLLFDRRDVAETLQAAMMPTLPVVDGVELIARYLPARTFDAVGGDWYDAFVFAERALTVSVGDVQGHDTVAAAVMGQVRSMLRALCSTEPAEPSRVFEALDRVMTALPLGRFATGIFASLAEQQDGMSMTWTNAGHPPPLLIAPNQPPEFLVYPSQPPLGLGISPAERASRTVDIPASSTLLLFTDGLVEQRHLDIDRALDRLRDAANRHRDLRLSEMIDGILADLFDDTHDDDVVLFGIRTRE